MSMAGLSIKGKNTIKPAEASRQPRNQAMKTTASDKTQPAANTAVTILKVAEVAICMNTVLLAM